MLNISTFYYISIFLIIILAFFSGAYFLETLGIQYVSEGGSPLFKIHLYSYISFFVFVFFFLRNGFGGIAKKITVFFTSWFFLLVSLFYLIIYGLFKFGTSGMAYVVDTLLVPLLIFPVLFELNKTQRENIAKLLLVCLCVNSFAAVYEYLRGAQIIAYDYDEYWLYFRSTAFLSHPLNNALVLSFLAIFLYKFRFLNPVLIFLTVSLALFCFGARTATVVFVFLSMIELFYSYKERYKYRKGLSFNEVLILKLVIFFGLAVVYYAVFILNFGSRIFENLTIDGSARTRFDVFNVFQYLTFEEFIFGASPEFFDNLMFYIENAIVENFVIGWFLYYGLAGSLFLIIFFYRFLINLIICSSRSERIAIYAFLFISISNNSLASKTPAFLIFLIAFVISFKSKNEIQSGF